MATLQRELRVSLAELLLSSFEFTCDQCSSTVALNINQIHMDCKVVICPACFVDFQTPSHRISGSEAILQTLRRLNDDLKKCPVTFRALVGESLKVALIAEEGN